MKPDIQTPETNTKIATTGFAFGSEQGPAVTSPELSQNSEIGGNTRSAESNQVLTTPFIQPMTLPTPIAVADDGSNQGAGGTPLVAADDDLIEKEWVQRAKKIVSDTKGDPSAREGQATELKVDYLQKRFGRKLGANK